MATNKNLMSKAARKQVQVILLLSDGHKYTVLDISFRCNIGDPRSVIRNIRNQGIEVKDEWVEADGGRYKRYWIENSPYNRP
jgi:hypothetical protein